MGKRPPVCSEMIEDQAQETAAGQRYPRPLSRSDEVAVIDDGVTVARLIAESKKKKGRGKKKKSRR